MSNIHEYPVTAKWNGGRDGSGTVAGDRFGLSENLAVPPEFQGPGGATNPEEMLTAAVASCYSITYGIVGNMRKLPIISLETKAVGEVTQNGPNIVFTSIVIRPTVTLAADATDDQVAAAEDVAHKADLYCIITNAVRDKVKISVEPTIIRG